MSLYQGQVWAQDKPKPKEKLIHDRFVLGLQYKPILPTRYFGMNPVEGSEGPLKVSIENRFGHAFGMLVRANITNRFAYEFGINYVRRNFGMNAEHTDLGLTDQSKFAMISYEIPNQGLIYIRLDKGWFMNAAFGVSLKAFASDVFSLGQDPRFSQESFSSSRWFSLAGTSNLGFEYRSPKSGGYYLGASLHWPFVPITYTFARYRGQNDPRSLEVPLRLTGRFLTLDLRYFFASAPKK